MVVRLARDVELFGLLEHLGSRLADEMNQRTRSFFFMTLPRISTSCVASRWMDLTGVISQALLGRHLARLRDPVELCPLVGMLDEGQGAVAQQIDRRLVAGNNNSDVLTST